MQDKHLTKSHCEFLNCIIRSDYRGMDALIKQGLNVNYAMTKDDMTNIVFGAPPRKPMMWPPPKDESSWHMAAFNPLCVAVFASDYGMVGKIIDAGADVNFRYIRFRSSTIYAIKTAIIIQPQYGKTDIIEWLLYQGARYGPLDLRLAQNNQTLKNLFMKYQKNYTDNIMKVTLSDEAIELYRDIPPQVLVSMIMTDEEVMELTRLGIYDPKFESEKRSHCDESFWWPKNR